MRSIWKAVVVCGVMACSLAVGMAGAEEAGICSLPAAEPALAASVGVEQEPLFVSTTAWCCLNGQLPCVQATVEACTAAGQHPYPYAGYCTRALCG
jgi:hypothetical protein